MRAILTCLAAMAILAGCWTRGAIQENLPRHVDKLPSDTVFYLGKTEKRVRKALADALAHRGFKVVDARKDADVAIEAKILSWEYNDAGFSGFYDRDEMEVSLAIVRVSTGLIVARHTVSIRSDFRILAKYVDSL